MNGHFINGRWTGAADKFFCAINPANNKALPRKFAEGGGAEAAAAASAAGAAFGQYAALPALARAEFLRAIADEIEKRGKDLTAAAGEETALPAARLEGERGRTTGQLRMFADFIEQGKHLEARRDAALPERAPLPRPDLRLMQKPLGAVAVFGASNFPLAFSVAGGDTASALAAGCPVVVKGHPAHPHTGEIVADAVAVAMRTRDIPAGAFNFVQGGSPELSRALVESPEIAAVGFTGSLRVGRELFNLACGRRAPIPFYAEMGSINPVFVLPNAAANNAVAIAQGWAQSLTLGGGQFCTNPGALFCPKSAADDFMQAATKALAENGNHTLLTPGIAASYRRATAAAAKHLAWRAAKNLAWRAEDKGDDGCVVGAAVFSCNIEEWLGNEALQEEIFGPAGVVVFYNNEQELARAASALQGQLTASLWLEEKDHKTAKTLLPALEQKAGRVLANGFPTGVEVADAMMHGGPYPAASYMSTSVGSLAIRRFLRPICYQNFPPALLPPALRALG